MTLSGAPTPARAVEDPAFELERRIDGIEVRRYPSAVVAEVLVDGPARQAGNQAFPILAGYLFGQNLARQRFAMASPVLQVAAPGRADMATTVTQLPARAGHVVQFMLPKGLTLGSAPTPTDSRVTVRALPARRVAAITYTGAWSDANDAAHLQLLTTALRKAGLHWSGEPVVARYNAPLTLWILRRNEIWLTLP